MKTVIYHNPRCRKSRETLALLEERSVDIEIVKYLEEPLSPQQIEGLVDLLGINPIELVRKGEAIWKEKFRGRDLSDREVVAAMAAHPKLIERPIVVKDGQARLGRPPENVLEIL